MLRIRTIILCSFVSFMFSMGLIAQCPPTSTSFFTDFEGPAPTEPDCSVFVESEFTVVSGDILKLNGIVSGQSYVVNMCNASEWDAVLAVYAPDTSLVAADDGVESGCGMGAKLTFTATSDGTYFVSVAKPDCSIDFTSNGKIQVFNNTNGVEPCPDLENVECSLFPYFIEGTVLKLSEKPFATCAKDWDPDALNSNPARVFVPVIPYNDFTNQPYVVTTSHGKVYDPNNITDGLTEISANNNFVSLIGLTQNDISATDSVVITFSSESNSGCIKTLTLATSFITESVETLCPAEGDPVEECLAESGSLIPPINTSYAPDAISENILADGATIDPRYNFLFVLTRDLDPTDDIFFDIIETSSSGVFNFAELEATEGTYNVHALSYLLEDEELINVTNGEAIFAAISSGALCADLSGTEFTFTIADNVGVENLEAMSDIKFYPIPTSNEINVDFRTEKASTGLIRIYDLTGRVLFENVIMTNSGMNNYKIDLSDYQQSVYLLGLTIDGETMTKRIVKR